MSEGNKAIVRTFENEFKNKANLDIVDQLMADTFVHHAPIPGVPPGREGLKQIGQIVFGHFADVSVSIIHLIGEGDLVCSRITANAVRKSNNEAVSWTENHFYQLKDGKIAEWWGEGGPPLG
ncbi:MAG: ester cyclase [Chloroflexi bacterium]|nr:ester cyclase [Chloroflexota bacterium]MCI0575614.1 ester cyclase [Chloroflexota bacterium]MCI0645049.1 ester cyclase [Chloroflexota bacterium]MCI0731885.1 ester cyclase [Chloroflexota bacterium]